MDDPIAYWTGIIMTVAALGIILWVFWYVGRGK